MKQKKNVSMLPSLREFVITSSFSIILYYVDMITDFLMLHQFYVKLSKTNENNRHAYQFFFYSSLIFTIFPIFSLIFFNVSNIPWKKKSSCDKLKKIFTITVDGLFNFGLIKK